MLWLGLLVFSAQAQNQSPTMEQLVGTWIGESNERDLNSVQPLPFRMTFQADSTVLLALIANGALERKVAWSVKNKAVWIDSSRFGPGQWQLAGDLLKISGWTPFRFHKLINIPFDTAASRQQLMNRVWESDSLRYYLYDNGTVCLENKKTTNRTLHYWQLVSVEQSLFLRVQGSQQETDGNGHFALQFVRLTNKTLTLRGWNGKQWGDTDFVNTQILNPNKTCEPQGFQLCDTYLFKPDQRYPYYEYKRGRLGAIRRLVDREFRLVPDVKQSGLVRFRFVVNCQGKAGMFEMLTVDENYERCQFDTRITDQLRQIVEHKITDWEPGKGVGDDTHNIYDTVCLLTFRFKEGQLVEIFP